MQADVILKEPPPWMPPPQPLRGGTRRGGRGGAPPPRTPLILSHLKTIFILNVSLNNINPKLTFFSSIDMTPSTPANAPKIKIGFSKERIYNL